MDGIKIYANIVADENIPVVVLTFVDEISSEICGGFCVNKHRDINWLELYEAASNKTKYTFNQITESGLVRISVTKNTTAFYIGKPGEIGGVCSFKVKSEIVAHAFKEINDLINGYNSRGFPYIAAL